MRVDVVSRQLGHASISTTANIYLHYGDAASIGPRNRSGISRGNSGGMRRVATYDIRRR
jgi:hypothetical protein